MKKIYIGLVFLLIYSNLFAQGIDDIKRRLGVKKAKKQKSDAKGFKQVIGKHYIVQVKDISRQEAELILRHMERILEEYLKLYEYPFGTQKCFVKVYGKEKDFKSAATAKGCGDCGGFYYSTGVNNYVVTYNSASLYSTLSHETFHQFIEKVFGKKPPIWFNEGLACYYETARFVNDRFVTDLVHSRHLFDAKEAISSRDKRWPKLKELDRMNYNRFYKKNKSINYAASWSLVYYLRNKDEGAFKNFTNDLKLGKSFSTCVRANYNMRVKELEKEWLEYIKALSGA